MKKVLKLKTFKIFLILIFIFLVTTFIVQSYSLYESTVKLNSNINKAIYLLKDEKMTFSLDPNAIYPSDEEYTYTFSVSNFENNKQGDFNLEYYVLVRTTTNLPITVKLYRNEEYSSSATNLLTSYILIQDDENTWYKQYNKTPTYDFYYQNNTTDIYTIVVEYPSTYSSYPEYAGVPENIEIGIYSKQKI